ncbi:uncharacterized protein LOC129293035 [Prosopis cineraria]|uniref:uncharacterized protein LOC129293035 n=1 Tax=Prosopis cineraria TaxID=364024 RepID=UPI00240FF092|nr:uncharacterized protein LOC129293035 [Prosopis cineraria]
MITIIILTVCSTNHSNYENNTIDSTVFRHVDGLAHVTFLNCYDNHTPFSPSSLNQICFDSSNNTYSVYYVLGQVYNGDCASVIMPIREAQTEAVLKGQLHAALDKGFGLKWKANEEQCDNCTKSGGKCGYDNQFLCFCKQGPQNISCPQPHESSASDCCKQNMVLRRGSNSCHCVYPIKLDLLRMSSKTPIGIFFSTN